MKIEKLERKYKYNNENDIFCSTIRIGEKLNKVIDVVNFLVEKEEVKVPCDGVRNLPLETGKFGAENLETRILKLEQTFEKMRKALN